MNNAFAEVDGKKRLYQEGSLGTIQPVAVLVGGFAKGAGMIRPDMATMLGFVATDAKVAPAVLARMVKGTADRSFNCATVDGDTSTNDSFILMATGRGPAAASAKDRALLAAVHAEGVVLAEFAYGGKLAPSFPKWLLDGTKPTRAAWYLKDRLLPPIYWHLMLKGREYLCKPHMHNRNVQTPTS